MTEKHAVIHKRISYNIKTTHCDCNENGQCEDDKEAEDENQAFTTFAFKVAKP